MTQADDRGPRILVGASSFADAAAALRLVDRLAIALRAGLGGILIEEENTLAICQIQDKRIILLNGTTMIAPSRSQVRTLLDADARAFRQWLARTAKTTGTDWVFAQEAGDLVNTALRTAAGWDILVIGHRPIHAIKGKIVLLETSKSCSAEMGEAARLLSRQFSADLVVFSVNHDEAAEDSIQNTGRFQFATLEEAMHALARTNAQAVLVDLSRGSFRTADDLSRLLEVSRCPLIVFGASNAFAKLENTVHIPPAPDVGGQTG